MATGKTAVGRELATCLGRRLFDTDQLIEKQAGLSIPQIFKRYGEEHFRDLESRVIATLGGYPSGELVVSTGGGAVIREVNRQFFFQWGIVILLTASEEAILERVQKTGGRPLLAGGREKEKIASLWGERRSYYQQCHLEIDTTGRQSQEVAQEIVRLLGF